MTLLVLSLPLGVACSSSGNSSDAAGAAGRGGSGVGGGGGAIGNSCQGIRRCVVESCADEACVLNTCLPQGTPAAQAAFQALYDCTKTMGACTSPSDINCFCLAQCLQDPPCAAQVDACTGGLTDSVCDSTCH
jgi:hypothetical protein